MPGSPTRGSAGVIRSHQGADMTITELNGRRPALRAQLNIEALEGREAPGGWGGWDWGFSWGSRWGGNHSWDSGWSRRSDQDNDGGNKSFSPPVEHSFWGGWDRSSHGNCKSPPPLTCQPPFTANSQVGGIVYVDSNLDAMFTAGEPLLP